MWRFISRKGRAAHTTKGRVVSVGVRALPLRATDATDATVPYEQLASKTAIRLNLDAHDTPCKLKLEVPSHITAARAGL